MTHIDVPPGVPGIRALFAFRPETGAALQQLAETLLRGPSTLTPGERETIAAVVSRGNACAFCERSHAAAAVAHLGADDAVDEAWRAATGEGGRATPKMRALLRLALQVRESGRSVTDAAVAACRDAGASDLEIHDAVLVAAAFCMFNRYVDGLAAPTPDDPAAYRAMGKVLAEQGYVRR